MQRAKNYAILCTKKKSKRTNKRQRNHEISPWSEQKLRFVGQLLMSILCAAAHCLLASNIFFMWNLCII